MWDGCDAIEDIEFSEKRSKLKKQTIIQSNAMERRASFVIFKHNHHYFLMVLRPQKHDNDGWSWSDGGGSNVMHNG